LYYIAPITLNFQNTPHFFTKIKKIGAIKTKKEVGRMYPNCKAELARKNITLDKLAKVLGLSITTTSLKLSGKYPLTLMEAKAIKKFLEVDIPLEVLFEEARG
jgi:hypothetical protein